MKKGFQIVLMLFFALFFLFLFINFSILWSTDQSIVSVNKVEKEKQVALILGARVYSSGFLSPILRDRVDTAIELYQAGKIERFLVSGDNGQENYDEVNAVKDYLLSLAIPAEDIFLDHAGFDTYDSMVRAKEIFEVESAYIVTQEFHLPRAVFLAQAQGISALGVISDKRQYRGEGYSQLREWPARFKSFFENELGLSPQFLGEPIPITGDSRESWD